MTSQAQPSLFDLKHADDICQSKFVVGSPRIESDSRESSISEFSDSFPSIALKEKNSIYDSSNVCSRLNSSSTLNPEPTNTIITTACGANGTYSEGYTGSFEGPEKLLEIWFCPKDSSTQAPHNQSSQDSNVLGMRSIPLDDIEKMLMLVNCSIIQSHSNGFCDSYILSESSLFVYPNKLIIKTCGTTTLLLALQRILDLASEYCKYLSPFKVFYSRKSFMFPELQQIPHNSWDNEVSHLNSFFPTGSAYTIGNLNSDYWHLFIASLDPISTQVDQKIPSKTITPPNKGDTTIEILMTGLDPKCMELFYCSEGTRSVEGLEGGKFVENSSGISSIYSKANVFSYLFSPCGLSSNGHVDDGYFTIHVTPESSCSYASFETNVPLSSPNSDDINTLISKVIKIFGPSQFTVTVFYQSDDDDFVITNSSPIHKQPSFTTKKRIDNFTSSDRIHYEFDDYHLHYSHFVKS
ncbi:S-adenosylmethionine decarboxylase proenzyme [Smittium culicis]|uniref:adenosylmethionine decarboxylase n=1 Tax=Smittium culicis TaxID=133412 RepID=A0A1R1XNS6_9FUNG|nr:S-adenosylmethionine decarboxylase proenzyme [Smittium culicis]